MINVEGYYKGVIVDGGLGQSSGGLPQEEWDLKATEVWDDDNAEYLPVDEDHDEITAYLILMSYKDKETKTAQQVKKVLGWDGASYPELAEIERAGVPVSFRVKFGTGDYSENLQVSWVAEPDASPTRSVSKISKEDAAALQARYGGVLAATKDPVKAASAKGKGKTAAKGKGKGKPTGKPTGRPAAPKATAKTETKTDVAVGKCTADDAYNECFALKRDDVSEEALNKLWVAAEAAVNVDANKITEEEYFVIKTDILKEVSKV